MHRKTFDAHNLRISPEKDRIIKKAAKKTGNTKLAYIIDAVDEKSGLVKDRAQLVREVAGWLSHEEAEELRQAVQVFEEVHEESRD
jgi:uncharacterized protein (DUF1778 family)